MHSFSSENWVLSRDQVRDVDRRAIEEYGLPGVVLMENAGRGAADLLLRHGGGGRVVVCCGKGNNGGDGYVIARHLELAGCEVQILAAFGVEALSGDARTHAEVARRGGIPISVCHDACDRATLDDWLHDSDWIVDALLGTGTVGSVREPHTSLIEAINRSPAHVLAVDLPSGLDCDSGEPLGPCVQAEVTATFVAWKSGFTRPSAAEYVGEVHVIDIGVPHKLLLELSRGSHWEPRN